MRDNQPATTTTVEATVDSLTGVTVESSVPVAEDEGTIVNIPLPIAVAVGQTDAVTYTVPAGQRLRITDIIVQNPNYDAGTLTIQRNEVTLYTFGLVNIAGDQSIPLVTPIELLAGEQLVVQVACSGLNDPTMSTCSQNVFVSGSLLPA